MECALLITCIIYCIFHSSNGSIMGINLSLAHINAYVFPSAYMLWPRGFSLEVWKPPLKHRCFVFSFLSFGFQGWSVCVSWSRVWGLTVDEFVGGAVAIWRQTSSQRWFISTSFLFSCEGCSNLWPPVSLLPPLPVSVCLSPPALQRPVKFFNIPA